MDIGAVGGGQAAPLQTSWTRAERACAAHHRGDHYYDLMAQAPDASAAPESPDASSPLQPGFTLHL